MSGNGERSVQVVGPGGIQVCKLVWEQLSDLSFKLTLEMSDSAVSVVDRDLFQSLDELRLLLESQRLSVAVQGSRKNAWASGMQRNMTGAHKIYICQAGRHVSKSDVVNIFDDADPSDLATVAAQRENYRLWRESVRSVRPV